MTGSAAVPGFQRHGLYYPYFHVRDDRWIKVAALYWPKLIRIVPDHYQTRDSYIVRALSDDFIVRQPPGQSVEAIAPRFAELIDNYASELRARFNITSLSEIKRTHSQAALPFDEAVSARGVTSAGVQTVTGVHVSEIPAWLRTMLSEAQLGLPGADHLSLKMPRVANSIDGHPLNIRTSLLQSPEREWHEWFLMHPTLVGIYTSVLAEDFATVNMLQPTTDQEDAYVVTNNWTTDRIAAVLFGNPSRSASPVLDELPEKLAFLALDLVVPADLDIVSVRKIIDIRERYSAEFFAFGKAIDEAAASIAELPHIRDQTRFRE